MIGKMTIENKTSDRDSLVVARISWLMQQKVRENPTTWPDGMSIHFNEELTEFIATDISRKNVCNMDWSIYDHCQEKD